MGGVLVGSIAVLLPEVAGNGHEPLNRTLNERLALGREFVYAAELRRRGGRWDLTLEGRRVLRDGSLP